MLLSILLILIIAINVYSGYHQGLIIKLINLVSYLVAGWVVFHFTHLISGWLASYQPQLSMPMVNAMLAILLFMITFLIIRRIGSGLNHVDKLPVINLVNAILGAVIGCFIGYLICLLGLQVGLSFDNQWIQVQYHASGIAQTIIQNSNGLFTFFNASRW